jgi:hypothetical protein
MITSADDRLRDEAAAAGVTVLMGKPYTEQDLVAACGAAVGRGAGQRLTPRRPPLRHRAESW